jgi:cell division ATPase FtsA
MREIVDMISYEINKYTNNTRKLAAGIVFTGGASQITHLRELVKLKTGMDVKIGKPLYVTESSPPEIVHPKYSTVVGLIMCGSDIRDKERNIEIPWTPSRSNRNMETDGLSGRSGVRIRNKARQSLKSFLDTITDVLYEKKEDI